jgi:hypothetical protein
VHRLRANSFQNRYEKLVKEGMRDLEARKDVARKGGHNRVDVTNCYIPLRG